MIHTILIVDDNPLIRRLVGAHIDANPDWRVCGEAADGREGIEKALQLHPDVIVMDLSMPVMNGIDATAALRRLMPGVPVIIFSEYSDVFSEEEAQAVGVAALVSKTDSIAVLLGKACALVR